jgi:hypothetical protein
MIRRKVSPWITGGLVFFCLAVTLPLNALAACEDDCKIPKSCKQYKECQVAHLECLAACKQKEAWELFAQSSEKSIAATERMAQVLEKTFEMTEKITLLLDKLITKAMQEKIPENPQETQEQTPPGTIPSPALQSRDF